MKKLSFKKLTYFISSLCLIALLSASCSSSSDDEPQDPAVVFTSLDANKTHAFTEEVITLNIIGTGYTDISLTSSNTKIKITKVASSIYEISCLETTSATIYAELKNNSHKEIKNIDLFFAEHGVKDFNTVEGLKVNFDKSSKIVSLLGEPDSKSDSADGLSEYWRYFSKGLGIVVVKKTSVINQIDMMSSNFFFTI